MPIVNPQLDPILLTNEEKGEVEDHLKLQGQSESYLIDS